MIADVKEEVKLYLDSVVIANGFQCDCAEAGRQSSSPMHKMLWGHYTDLVILYLL